MAYWLDLLKRRPARPAAPPAPRAVWEAHPAFFRGRWAVLHALARELGRPDLEPEPVRRAAAPALGQLPSAYRSVTE